MSDTRRAISERLLNEHRYFSSVDTLLVGTRDVEKCMSEYAAAVLEDEATNAECRVLEFRDADDVAALIEVAVRLRARAAQERQR